MPIITLPDGSQRAFKQPISVVDVAASIGTGLAKATLAGRVNGQLKDASYLIEMDATLEIITDKHPEGIGLDIIRHSSAHLLAHAVKQLFPSAQVTIGPVIEDGFYYDFAFERAFTPEDIEAIEVRMHELAKQDIPVRRFEMSRDEAVSYFKDLGEDYKVKIIQEIPSNEPLSFYEQGDFTDLCRGPHVPNVNKLKAFKLTKLAGAYWRGDSQNEMLQRIYGTAWTDKKDLKAYLYRLEEAEKRDHRKLGKVLDLFHLQEEAPGMVFWHPKGWAIWQQVEQYIRHFQESHGYQEVRTPQLVDRSLWERSGHWAKFREHMFTTETDERDYAVKPMNCPCHVQIFNQGLTSYRQLPIRLAEFGCCHRNEVSGALHGLMRVRSMVQDDGHIFCTEAQIFEETLNFIDQVYQVYKRFGFTDILLKLATRPDERVGSDEIWDKAEHWLQSAIERRDLAFSLNPGEGAFYGPKIEFSLRDSIGRVWQCGTLQLDFSMPERLEAFYIDQEGHKQHPVMLHRAMLGSMERFMGILIEHHAGVFPAWLAPVQVVVMNITDKQTDYTKKVVADLRGCDLRVISDVRNEKINFKIREHTLQRIPYLLVIGDREVNQETVSVRTREGQDLGSMSINAFAEYLIKQCTMISEDL